ncbi:MAG: SDR family NAD(P)-dependent oxidoreductase [Acidimicrobiales bacterium]|nr:SDR family NAD(P)-dependent oxidoreductase [Acidimicrobiales bacterium]
MPEGQRGDRFTDKVAVVTGGGSGIGLATTRRFVSEGGRVVVGDLDTSALDTVAAELGDAVLTRCCDVAVEADVEALAEASVDHFGGLDIAFANAGIGSAAHIVDADAQEWSRVLDVNLTGPFLTIKHAARRMGEGGSIVVTASLNAVQAGKAMGAYCASKAGVAMLVQVAALELGERGIRVNAVAPGLVRTSLTEGAFMLPSIVDEYVENTPLGRYASPDEIANVVTFLASGEAGFVSGSMQLVDGGAQTMRYPDILGRVAEAAG